MYSRWENMEKYGIESKIYRRHEHPHPSISSGTGETQARRDQKGRVFRCNVEMFGAAALGRGCTTEE